jgi:hypothetical protein
LKDGASMPKKYIKCICYIIYFGFVILGPRVRMQPIFKTKTNATSAQLIEKRKKWQVVSSPWKPPATSVVAPDCSPAGVAAQTARRRKPPLPTARWPSPPLAGEDRRYPCSKPSLRQWPHGRSCSAGSLERRRRLTKSFWFSSGGRGGL